jgi:hypothetical protein
MNGDSLQGFDRSAVARAIRPAVDFRVLQRDYDDGLHWDVYADGNRLFTIRGEAGNIQVRDCLSPSIPALTFRSAEGALAYIMEEMVHRARATP